MTLTNDPLKGTLSNWRLKQNIVLLIYLNAYFSKDTDARMNMPYTVSTQLGKKGLKDRDGHLACEFEAVGNTFLVNWYRSFADYTEIDRIGQLYNPRVEAHSGRTKAN